MMKLVSRAFLITSYISPNLSLHSILSLPSLLHQLSIHSEHKKEKLFMEPPPTQSIEVSSNIQSGNDDPQDQAINDW